MVRLLALLVLVPLLALALVACARPDDEARIRARLDSMSTALAEGDSRSFMAPLAEDFSAETWDLDRRAVQLLLLRELRSHERIRARIFDIEVELFAEQRANAQFQVVLTGGRGLVPEQGSWYRVHTGWRHDGSDWELIAARWERLAGGGSPGAD